MIHDSDSDEEIPQARRKAGPSKVAASTKKTRGTTKRSQPLFLDDSDNDHDAGLKHEEESPEATLESEPPPSNKPAKNSRSKRSQPIVEDDDSDNGAVFKGLRAGRRR